jgi:hypothetical protein
MQMSIGDTNDGFKQHVITQHFTYTKSLQMLAAQLIADSVLLAPRINKPDGHFAYIANECPLHGTPEARTRMIEYVRKHTDVLQEELVLALASVKPTQDLRDAVRTQMFTDAIETLRVLSSLQLMHERRTTSAYRMLRDCKRVLCQQFHANLERELYADNTDTRPFDESTCFVCTKPFATVGDTIDEDTTTTTTSSRSSNSEEDEPPATQNDNQPGRLKCCGQPCCMKCIAKSAYITSNNGRKATAACPFCRDAWPLYTQLNGEL